MSRHHYRIRCRRRRQTRPPPKTPSHRTHWDGTTSDHMWTILGQGGHSSWIEYSSVDVIDMIQELLVSLVWFWVLDHSSFLRRHDCRLQPSRVSVHRFITLLSPGTESPLAALINFQFQLFLLLNYYQWKPLKHVLLSQLVKETEKWGKVSFSLPLLVSFFSIQNYQFFW